MSRADFLPGDDSDRLYLCAACRRLVRICRSCDRGQIYCRDGDCRVDGRRVSTRLARRRYQSTPKGARNNARRQKRHRARRARNRPTVTHQGSPEPPSRAEESPATTTSEKPLAASATTSSSTTEKEATSSDPDARALSTVPAGPAPPAPSAPISVPPPRCDFCGKSCGPLSRRSPLRHRRYRHPGRAFAFPLLR